MYYCNFLCKSVKWFLCERITNINTLILTNFHIYILAFAYGSDHRAPTNSSLYVYYCISHVYCKVHLIRLVVLLWMRNKHPFVRYHKLIDCLTKYWFKVTFFLTDVKLAQDVVWWIKLIEISVKPADSRNVLPWEWTRMVSFQHSITLPFLTDLKKRVSLSSFYICSGIFLLR